MASSASVSLAPTPDRAREIARLKAELARQQDLLRATKESHAAQNLSKQKIDELKHLKTNLQDEFQTARMGFEMTRKEIEELLLTQAFRKEFDTLKAKYSELLVEKQALENQARLLQTKEIELQHDNTKLSFEIKQMMAAVQKCDERIDLVQKSALSEREQLQAKERALAKDLIDREEQVANLTRQLSKALETNEELKMSTRAALAEQRLRHQQTRSGRVRKLLTQIAGLKEELNRAKKLEEELRSAPRELSEEVKSDMRNLHQLAEQSASQLKIVSDKLIASDAREKHLESELSSVRETYQAELLNSTHLLAQKSSAVNEMQIQIQTTQKEFEDLKAAAEIKEKLWFEESLKAREQLRATAAEFDLLRKQMDEAGLRVSQLQSEKEKLEERNRLLESEISARAQTRELEDLSKVVFEERESNYQKQIEILTQERDELRTQFSEEIQKHRQHSAEQLQELKSISDKKVVDLESKLRDREAAARKLEADNTMLQKKLELFEKSAAETSRKNSLERDAAAKQFEERVASLENELRDAKEQLERERTARTQTRQLEDLSKVALEEREISLQKQMESERENLQKELSGAIDRAKSLERTVAEKQTEIAQLKASLEREAADHQRSQQDISSLRETISALKQETQRASVELESHRERNKQEIAQLQHIIEALKHESQSLAADGHTKQSEIAQLSADILSLKQAYEKLNEDSSSAAKSFEENIAALQFELSRKNQQLEEYNAAIQAFTTQQVELTALAGEFDARLQQLSAEKDKLAEEKQAAIRQREDDIASLLERQRSEAQTETAALEAKLRQQIHSLETTATKQREQLEEETARYRTLASEREQDLHNHSEEIAKLRGEISTYESKVAELSTVLEAERKEFEQKLQSVTSSSQAQFAEQVRTEEARLGQALTQLREAKAEEARLTAALAQTETKLRQTLIDSARAHEEKLREELATQSKQFDEEIRSMRAELEQKSHVDLETRVRQLHSESAQQFEERLRKEMAAQSMQFEEKLSSESKQFEQQLSTAMAEKSQLESRLRDAAIEKRELEAKISQAEQQREAAAEDLLRETSSLRAELVNLNTVITQTREQLAAERNQHAKAVQSLEEAAAAMKSEHLQKESLILHLQDQLTNAQQENLSAASNFESQMKKMRDELQATQSQASKLWEDAAGEASKLREELRVARDEMATSATKLREKEKEMRSLREQLTACESAMTKVHAESAHTQEMAEQLKDQVALALRAETDRVSAETEQLRLSEAKLRQELTVLQTENANLRQQIVERDAKASQQHHEETSRRSDLENEIASLRKLHEELTAKQSKQEQTHKTEMSELKKKHSELISNAAQKVKSLEEMSVTLNDLKVQFAQITEDNKRLETKTRTLTEELYAKQKALESARRVSSGAGPVGSAPVDEELRKQSAEKVQAAEAKAAEASARAAQLEQQQKQSQLEFTEKLREAQQRLAQSESARREIEAAHARQLKELNHDIQETHAALASQQQLLAQLTALVQNAPAADNAAAHPHSSPAVEKSTDFSFRSSSPTMESVSLDDDRPHHAQQPPAVAPVLPIATDPNSTIPSSVVIPVTTETESSSLQQTQTTGSGFFQRLLGAITTEEDQNNSVADSDVSSGDVLSSWIGGDGAAAADHRGDGGDQPGDGFGFGAALGSGLKKLTG